MFKLATLSILATLACFSAVGQDKAAYIDQRSTATELITSYYNAINRHEYARAWDYWGGHNEHQSYEEFVAGVSNTQSVKLKTGPETGEGAAGSLYYSLPVAIEATSNDGATQVFSGCYTLRLVQPEIQEPPFRPMHIEAATLNPRTGEFAEIGPESCD